MNIQSKDIDLSPIEGITFAILGYGSQGRAQALNLKDSGYHVIIAQRKGSKNYDLAIKDGFEPKSIEECVKTAHILKMLLPDEVHKQVFETEIRPHIRPKQALVFAHGFSVHYKEVSLPNNIDVYLIAPKAQGHGVRKQYLDGCGFPCLFGVYQDASKNARNIAMAHAKALGGADLFLGETSFQEETEADLFGEQTVLCGGVPYLILKAFETMTANGIRPEVAYIECLHEIKLISDLIYENGLAKTFEVISNTAEFGAYEANEKIVSPEVGKSMDEIMKQIKNGSFKNRFLSEIKNNFPKTKENRTTMKQHPIEKVGKSLRYQMNPLFKNKLIED